MLNAFLSLNPRPKPIKVMSDVDELLVKSLNMTITPTSIDVTIDRLETCPHDPDATTPRTRQIKTSDKFPYLPVHVVEECWLEKIEMI